MSYAAFSSIYDKMILEDINYPFLCDFIENVFGLYGINPDIVLDIACGTGGVTGILADRGYDMIGIDKSYDMLNIALSKRDDILYLNQSFENGCREVLHEKCKRYSSGYIRIKKRPNINKDKCIKCGECAKICPPKTMVIEKGNFPHLKNIQCIRCWCCAEVCPKNAIQKSKRPILGKILLKTDKEK